MTRIYEALRRQERRPLTHGETPQEPVDEAVVVSEPAPEDEPVGREPQLTDESRAALDRGPRVSREMQTLYRSVQPLLAGEQRGPTILFSSAHPGEGKTTVCGSFAAALASTYGKSVLVLDADRNHVLAGKWGSQQDDSLSILERSAGTVEVLQIGRRVGSQGSITVLPIKSPHADSPEMGLVASVKEKLARAFDYILIDAPSVADVSWSPSIAATTDGVILVVEAERTRWPVALNAKQEFEAAGARVIGVFLNKRRFYIPTRIYQRV